MADELRRIDEQVSITNILESPAFRELPEEKRKELLAKHAERLLDTQADLANKVVKSKVAEHDMHVSINALNELDKDRKVYSSTKEFETGSGKVRISVKGGDIRFIIPVIIAIGVVIVLAILLLRR